MMGSRLWRLSHPGTASFARHSHPLEEPEIHVELEEMSVLEIIERLGEVLQSLKD